MTNLPKHSLAVLFAGFLLTATASVTTAEESPGEQGLIRMTCVVEKLAETVNDEGQPVVSRVPVTRAVPGDELIYTISYRNRGTSKAENVVVNNAVPEHMRLGEVGADLEGTVIQYSVDRGQTFDVPEKLRVVGMDDVERPATIEDYTHIRWVIPRAVEPEEEGAVYFKAVLR